MQIVFYLAVYINHESFQYISVILIISGEFNRPSFCKQVVQIWCEAYNAETSRTCMSGICVETGLCVSLSNTHV